ncbi:MAG: hypothetical protein WHV44_12615 [Anaerolineales bacterium]
MKETLKSLLGNIPYAADLYWLARQRGKPFRAHYQLESLRQVIDQAAAEARPHAARAPQGKRVFLFATLHYWVEQSALVGLILRGLGHDVTLAYLPYSDWRKPISKFDARRQDLYTREVLSPAADLLRIISLLETPPAPALPAALAGDVALVSTYDTQYTDQVEEIDPDSALYRLRLERNTFAAQAALRLLQDSRPDVVVVPNGTILELGAVYRVARHLGIPVVTYEFNDNREQFWMALNDEVMRQNTDAMWAARGGLPLTDAERGLIEALESARMGGRAFGKSARKWQDVATQGAEQARAALGLDSRPVILLATNVLGDSLTLGRNIFSRSMAEWISETVKYFANRPEVQLVIRVHPGERLTHGPSMVDVVTAALPELPEHIKLVRPLEKINTYDLMELTQLGLVYTTTTGMEMSMHGIPVIAAGETHYRKRGFTLDPHTWDDYYALLNRALANLPAQRLTPAQVELAWRYAYRFFFEYPRPFPWKLAGFWQEYPTWTVGRVLSEEGRAAFGRTFDHLTGEPIDWTNL